MDRALHAHEFLRVSMKCSDIVEQVWMVSEDHDSPMTQNWSYVLEDLGQTSSSEAIQTQQSLERCN